MSDDNPGGGPPGGLDLGALMRTARALRDNLQAAQQRAAEKRAEGSAGGGLVTAVADGRGVVHRVRIDGALIETGDREMIEDLVVAAVNQALQAARQGVQDAMRSAAQGLPLPIDPTLLGDD